MMGGGSRPDEMCDLALWCSTTHNSRGADSGKRGIRGSRHQWWCTGTIFRLIALIIAHQLEAAEVGKRLLDDLDQRLWYRVSGIVPEKVEDALLAPA